MTERVTLSAAQRGLWALEQLAPGSAFYNVALACRVTGPLDRSRLEDALAAIVKRHRVLRTTIEADEGLPTGRVHPSADLVVAFDDRSDVPEGRRDAEAVRLAAAEAARPFDLATDLPFRVRLVSFGVRDHVLSVTAHHVAADETSLRTVGRELAQAYASGADSLPPPGVQYEELAAREGQALRGEDLDVLLAFWRKTLRDAPERLRLPADRPASAVPTFKGATVATTLDDDLLRTLDALGRDRGASFESVVLASFAVLLHRYTSDEDLVLGWPVDARTDETRGVIGTFVNVLPVRLHVHAGDSFEQVLERTAATVEAVQEHRELPFETLIEELRPRRGRGHTPLFQVAVSVGEEPAGSLELPGVEVTPIPLDTATAQFDLFLDVRGAARHSSWQRTSSTRRPCTPWPATGSMSCTPSPSLPATRSEPSRSWTRVRERRWSRAPTAARPRTSPSSSTRPLRAAL